MSEDQKNWEDSIRERMMSEGFPIEQFIFSIKEFDIDFIREFKDDIWWDEVFDWIPRNEEYIVNFIPQLMEFWKEYEN